MKTLVRLGGVLSVLALALFTVVIVISVGSATTGPSEKLVVLALAAGCVLLAAQLWKLARSARGRQAKRG